MPFLSDVLAVNVTDIGSSTTRKAGDVERNVHLFINALAQAVLSTLKFHSNNGNAFLGILGDNAAVESYLSFLRRSSFSRQFKILIKWAKKERYGVQGGLRERELFGEGNSEIDVFINPYQNVGNIDLGTGTSSTCLIAAERGGLHSGPDELYMNGWIVRGKGPFPYLRFDRPPDPDTLQTLASQLGKKDYRELRFIVPFGERHLSTTQDEQEKGLRLVDALYKAGVAFSPEAYETIRKKMTQDGMVENGNIKLVRNVFPATFDLIQGKADVILGVDLAGHYAQAVFLLKAFGVGEGIFRFASYETLRDRRSPGDPWPNIYENKFTDIDLGTLRKYRVFPDPVPIDPQQRQIHIGDVLGMNRFVETENGAILIAGIRNFSHWVDALDDPVFDDPMSTVTVSFLAAGFSEKKRVAVTYRTIIGELLAERETAEREYALAEAYIEFGNFQKAIVHIKRALKRGSSADFRSRCKLLATYWFLMRKLTSGEEDDSESTLGRTSDPRFRDLYARGIQILSNMESSAQISFERVRVLLPQLATLMKKMGQQIGDVFRLLGQTAWEEAEKFAAEREEASKRGDLQRVQISTFLEEKAFEATEKHAAHAVSCYENALKFFPEEGRRTDRQQLEFELYLALIELVGHLRDFDTRRNTDHFVRQEYYYKLFEKYLEIAKIYEQNGFNLRAIYFYKRACELIERLGDLGIAGIVPLTARFKIPELYVSEGWYELARQEYRVLAERNYLETLCKTGSGDDSALYVDGALRRAIIGFLLTETFCGNAVDPLHMTMDPHDRTRTVYSELEGLLLTRFKELVAHEEARWACPGFCAAGDNTRG